MSPLTPAQSVARALEESLRPQNEEKETKGREGEHRIDARIDSRGNRHDKRVLHDDVPALIRDRYKAIFQVWLLLASFASSLERDIVGKEGPRGDGVSQAEIYQRQRL